MILQTDALDGILALERAPALIVTDPPYAFGGVGAEHALSATVAIVLRQCAEKLADGGWMLVFSASSWRSVSYAVESVRGIKGVMPVRIGTWAKPVARTKARTPGWLWASVAVVAFKKGDGRLPADTASKLLDMNQDDLRPIRAGLSLDHVTAEPLIVGRRAQLPKEVAEWAVAPYAVPGRLFLDPFAGSGALCAVAERYGMEALGFEVNAPASAEPPHREDAAC